MGPERDLLIVGGGPVGATLALALAGCGLDVELLEARAEVGSSSDDRTLAISHGTRMILERIGVWDALREATPIETIHVSQRGGFGRSLLDARDLGLPALGYVLRYANLQRALGAALGTQSHVRLIPGARVEALQAGPEGVCVTTHQDGATHILDARLLVIADGGTRLAGQAGAIIRTRDYAQHAIVATVAASRGHARRAYERFTPQGPVALLPFEDRYALVWTATPGVGDNLIALTDDQFIAALQEHFGDRAGRFQAVGPRGRFPLSLRYAIDPVRPRMVLLGNAAQALHPIAGQGLNLGLRDAWDLARTLRARTMDDPGATTVLSGYRAARRLDRAGGIAITDSLVRIFSNDVAPLRALRGTALALFDIVPPARRAFARSMIFGGSL